MRNIALFYFLDHQIHPIFNQNLVFSQPDVLALGEEADFEALNRLPALNLIRRTKLQSL